ncbi:hypothetical protein KY386_03475 [Candidatus Parcubacteria bacterium]|nr:hypothetical protein [Candidatus Parcubacteria bacterium]
MKTRILRYGAIAMATVGLGLGVAAAHTAEIDTTGPDSHNRIDLRSDARVDLDVRNDVDVDNDTDQVAVSGDATVRHNTDAGDAETGSASNDSHTSTTVTVAGGAGLCDCVANVFGGGHGEVDASIHLTGPDSNNQINVRHNTRVDVDVDNDVDVRNDVDQDAYSGDAKVKDNTLGGSATSGDASNSSTTSTSVSL